MRAVLGVVVAFACAAKALVSAQDIVPTLEVNTIISDDAFRGAGARERSRRVVITDCRRISRTSQSCRAGAYLTADHASFWERRVRFEFVDRASADGGPLWWGQVASGDVLERLYVTTLYLTITRITRFPDGAFTVTVPRRPPESDPGLHY